MILATHAIFSAYGFWLPNDPRGSWSTFVASWELFKYGPATKITTHHSVAHRPHDTKLRQAAKSALTYPPVCFTGIQARAIARGFARAVRDGGFVIHACSMLPDHVHVLFARHRRPARDIVAHLKSAGTKQLRSEGLHPFQMTASREEPMQSPWARGCWTVFLDSQPDVRRAIRYVQDNPLKEGKRRQPWSFVQCYSG
jgi:REP element-mobilizing transposase RayT